MGWIAWPMLIPLLLGTLVLLLYAVVVQGRMHALAETTYRASAQRNATLIEGLVGFETLKAMGAEAPIQRKWEHSAALLARVGAQLRLLSSSASNGAAFVQQTVNLAIVILGVWLIGERMLTMGGLIACSILGGRVLAAVMMVPGLMVQHAHARVAIDGVEGLYKLATETTPGVQPLTPSVLHGHYVVDSVSFAYGKAPPAVDVKRLTVTAGERIGILGPVGSGKSTLLRMMAGLYQPTAGRVLIDGLDVSHVAREAMSRHVGYVQQDHRLFEGSLRQNLLVGLPNPGDDVIKAAMAQTGLLDLVAAHPMGLDLPIFEGGKGLSGGQKQLLVFTRLVLAQPKVMLLDEPTASMDGGTEARCLNALRSPQLASSTLVLVTHKPSMLAAVSRVLVMSRGQVVMDGPRDAVLAQLSKNTQAESGAVRQVSPAGAVEATGVSA